MEGGGLRVCLSAALCPRSISVRAGSRRRGTKLPISSPPFLNEDRLNLQMVKAGAELSRHFLPPSRRRASDILPASFYLLRRRSGRSSPDLIVHIKRAASDKKWISQELVNEFVPILLIIPIPACFRPALLSQQVRLRRRSRAKSSFLAKEAMQETSSVPETAAET